MTNLNPTKLIIGENTLQVSQLNILDKIVSNSIETTTLSASGQSTFNTGVFTGAVTMNTSLGIGTDLSVGDQISADRITVINNINANQLNAVDIDTDTGTIDDLESDNIDVNNSLILTSISNTDLVRTISYGCMYEDTQYTVSIGDSNNWYFLTGWLPSTCNEAITLDTVNGSFQVLYNGRYQVTYTISSATSNPPTDDLQYAVFVNVPGANSSGSTNILPQSQCKRLSLSGGTIFGLVSAQFFVELNANDYIKVGIRNLTDTDNVNVAFAQFTIKALACPNP